MSNLSPEIIGLIGVVVMLVLMFTRMWVGLSMIIVGIIGIIMIGGVKSAISLMGTFTYTRESDYAISCVPLFIFMGCLLFHTGMGSAIYEAARVWLSKIKGGLAMATVAACGVFAAICGDSVATAVTMGRVAYPEMNKHGYDDSLACCSVAAGGTIGVMIPPSIPFIMYGVLTENSIGQLFTAGIIPGVSQVIFYIITIVIWVKLRPKAAPEGFKVTMKERGKKTLNVTPVMIILIVMLVGMYAGFFTPTEAGAFSAFFTMIIAIVQKKLHKENLLEAIREAVTTSTMVTLLVLGAFFFTKFLTLSKLPAYISTAVINMKESMGLSPTVILILIVILYIILGMFMDILAALMLTIPIIYPIVVALGFSPIWFGVIFVRVMEIGMISPPFGLNLFSLAKSVKMPMITMYKGVWPFLVADFIHVLILCIFPEISLLLLGGMG